MATVSLSREDLGRLIHKMAKDAFLPTGTVYDIDLDQFYSNENADKMRRPPQCYNLPRHRPQTVDEMSDELKEAMVTSKYYDSVIIGILKYLSVAHDNAPEARTVSEFTFTMPEGELRNMFVVIAGNSNIYPGAVPDSIELDQEGATVDLAYHSVDGGANIYFYGCVSVDPGYHVLTVTWPEAIEGDQMAFFYSSSGVTPSSISEDFGADQPATFTLDPVPAGAPVLFAAIGTSPDGAVWSTGLVPDQLEVSLDGNSTYVAVAHFIPAIDYEPKVSTLTWGDLNLFYAAVTLTPDGYIEIG